MSHIAVGKGAVADKPRDGQALASVLQTLASASHGDPAHISRESLNALLQCTTDPRLLPDAVFSQTARVVMGKNVPAPQLFAESLADFLTSDDFHCRQPIFHDYFVRRYGSFGNRDACADRVPFWRLDQVQGGQVVWLDPRRVRSIHLLFAGKASNVASRFGHVALRLVVCPQLDSTDTACDENLFEHLALGYRAHVDELSLDMYKGLTGRYRAHLYALNFMDTYEEYAVGEFRELFSLPLVMDATARAEFVRRLADIHWRFAGDYSFFSDNCATQLQEALRIVWPEAMAAHMANDRFVRPDRLFTFLRSTPLAEGEKLADLARAESEGFYFPSTRKYYEQALAEVTGAMGTSPMDEIDDYLFLHPLQRRSQWVSNEEFSERLTSDRHLLEAQLMLEEYAVRQGKRQLMLIVQNYMVESGMTTLDSSALGLNAEQTRLVEDCLFGEIRKRVSPALHPGGIPGPEIGDSRAEAAQSTCKDEASRAILRKALSDVFDRNPDVSRRLKLATDYLDVSVGNVLYLKAKYLGEVD